MWIIDRFEGDKAIIEYQNRIFDVPKKSLPPHAEEGDVLKIVVDKEGTDRVQGEIDKLKEELFNK